MSLDLSAVGYKTEPHSFSYDFKTAALYALGIGAGPAQLPYLYEGFGPQVYPTFAVVPGYQVLTELVSRTKADMAMVVHGGQAVRVHRPLPPQGTLKTTGTITGIYDLKRLSQIVFETQSELDGELVSETEWSILVRDCGGFGGPRPPKSTAPKLAGLDPMFEYTETVRPDQALLYRLSGDLNPLHADPEFARRVGFEQGPILHGLCTYGFVARAVIEQVCQGDARRLRSFTALFRKPVWPGESLKTVGYRVNDTTVGVEAFAGGRPEPVITGAWAEIS